MVVVETMLFTIYYVLITVFQGKAALVDAIASKVGQFVDLTCNPFYCILFSVSCVVSFLTLQRELQIKKKFVRYISHEIRTPLSAVTMGLQVLSEDLRSAGATDAMLATVKTLEHASDVAVDILNDLLLYDKLDSGLLKLDVQQIPFIPFVTEIMEPFQLQVQSP